MQKRKNNDEQAKIKKTYYFEFYFSIIRFVLKVFKMVSKCIEREKIMNVKMKFIVAGIILILSFFWINSFAETEHKQTDTTKVHTQEISDGQTTHEEAVSNTEEHSEGHGGASLGAELPLWTVIPFAGILLSIALFPLLAGHFWHHNFGKISLFWALLFAIPFLWAYHDSAIYEILHIYLLDYIPFIILLWALYTVAGGILLEGALVGTPVMNMIVLLIGTLMASWVGTTGAAMLLIRPIIRMNKTRKNKIHIIVFFIFLVANIGGSLTPLGDPPLFLGFLHGVPFFWTFKLFPYMAFVAVILLTIFFLLDTYLYRKQGLHLHMKEIAFLADGDADSITIRETVEVEDDIHNTHKTRQSKLRIRGLHNSLFLLGILGGVLFSGMVHLGEVNVFGVHMHIQGIIRDLVLIAMGLLSLKTTKLEIREGNEFGWFPIVEVAKLFAGIFMTIIPALAILKAGQDGALSWLIDAVKDPYHYFWVTGTLSSFLDNAPTYLTFFNSALGRFYPGIAEIEAVTGLISSENAIYLKAIAAGAVFFGAMTYIGNAPNFMVKAIAEENDIKMPSFFGYMLWSVAILVPVFILVTFIFF